jgi:putative nucleotidyltransferase with HDIG domain
MISRSTHLVTRFFGSVRARPLDAATVAWVAAVLEPGELQTFDELPRADRAEGVAVARRVEASLGGTSQDRDGRWLAAALLHDAGKQLSGYGTIGRAAATVVTIAAGERRVRGWATGSSSVRARMGRYATHDVLGAELLRERGARPEVVAWAEAHHRPDRWPDTGIPLEVCRALAAADGEPIAARNQAD